MIQKTAQNALDGTLIGNANSLRGRSPIHEMAKEPRSFRRAIAERMGWSAEQRAHFQKLNADLKFFTSDSLVEQRMHVQAFPAAPEKLYT